ncbi:uncharacterized protein LOC119606409 [Lucilia sericata]|uniref:uncharacterized protein LOC119606409 n=1 Tax=Lucilia sericata TaxID=13632 RepID=UPI0018A81B54|nr:uncharacterized protein LOC119606409 [Lucilia sericata]
MKFLIFVLIILPYILADDESETSDVEGTTEAAEETVTGAEDADSGEKPEDSEETTSDSGTGETDETHDGQPPTSGEEDIPIDEGDYGYFDYSMGPYPGYSGSRSFNQEKGKFTKNCLIVIAKMFVMQSLIKFKIQF